MHTSIIFHGIIDKQTNHNKERILYGEVIYSDSQCNLRERLQQGIDRMFREVILT